MIFDIEWRKKFNTQHFTHYWKIDIKDFNEGTVYDLLNLSPPVYSILVDGGKKISIPIISPAVAAKAVRPPVQSGYQLL